MKLSIPLGSSALLGVLAGLAAGQITPEDPMVRGDTAATGAGFTATPIWTTGETYGTYQAVGIPDGIFAFPAGSNVANVIFNHELGGAAGAPYTLASGAQLTGARISTFRIRREIVGGVPQTKIERANLAYSTVYDRHGDIVVDASQVNEQGSSTLGFERFCSSNGVFTGSYGFVDNVYFCGEETGKPTQPHGGSLWALDVRRHELWAVPAAGRLGWENVCALDAGDPDKVALLIGDDTEGAALFLYVGDKNAVGDGSFLDRNGLASGHLYAWKTDNGDLTPQQFNGVNSIRSGSFVEVTVKDPAQAGQPGYDDQGYLDNGTLQAQPDTLGCFSFARPEDLDTNPLDGTQVAFVSTGRGSLFSADNWGDAYVVDVDFSSLTADVIIIHDADSLAVPDSGIRSPDNLDWAGDGKIYITEDRATSPSSLFGAATHIEASVWRLDPITRSYRRIGEIDRTAVPAGSTDSSPTDLGNWEASGVTDVTALFGTLPGERLLLVDVQAHSIKDGAIGGSTQLVEGGQLLFLSRIGN